MVLAVVLLAELLALTLTLARASATPFLTDLARISFFIQWLGLTSAGLLCAARRPLARRSITAVTLTVFGLLAANTVLLSLAALATGRWLEARGLGVPIVPTQSGSFVVRNLGISVIVSALLLRYFYVSHEWRRHVRAEARSRIDALQARIRPHFLFNSMNTIAALTRSDPPRAEEAVEDLADLFRATLRDSDALLTLKEELELSRIYQRIEMLRIGDRLSVRWDVAALPMRARVPGLTIQPLLENAIYHGIEPLDGGGTVTVSGRVADGRIRISVANPVARETPATERRGNRLALDNIRDRLRLAYGEAGGLDVVETDTEYRVEVSFPLSQ